MKEQKKQINKARTIAKLVARYYEVPLSSLFRKTRAREVAQKRQVIHFFCREYTRLSLQGIGDLYKKDFGTSFSHCTVIHSCKIVDNMIFTDKKFKSEIDEIKNIISDHIAIYSKADRTESEKDFLAFRMDILKLCRISKNKEILTNELIAVL